jgi:phosphosulfolactate synthase
MTTAEAPLRLACRRGRCGAAIRYPAHHDRLLTVDSNVDALLELLEIAVTWHELDYSETPVVSPQEWLTFTDDHAWRHPDRARQAFSLAVDIASRRAAGPVRERPLADVIELVRRGSATLLSYSRHNTYYMKSGDGVTPPRFLDLPARSAKPRSTGLTHVLDQGIGAAAAADLLASAAQHIDIWKVGWGTGYLDSALAAKLELLRTHDVAACLGGTLLEIAWAQGVAADCLAWAQDLGFPCVEVSRGTVAMSQRDKRELIGQAVGRFRVLAEVGAKEPGERNPARHWPDECRSDLDAGADLLVTEGRQSGTVGTFDKAGRVRPEVVEAVVCAVGAERVVFEAPWPAQQAWFVRRFGSEVNLGNVALADVLAVETLRLGLRSDTAAVPRREDPQAEPA